MKICRAGELDRLGLLDCLHVLDGPAGLEAPPAAFAAVEEELWETWQQVGAQSTSAIVPAVILNR